MWFNLSYYVKFSTMSLLRSNLQIFVTALIILLIISLIQWYSSIIEDEIVDVARIEMEETVQQLDLFIEEIVATKIQDVTLIADFAAKNNIQLKNALEFFNSQSHTVKFDFIYFVDLDGKGISSQNIKVDFSKNNTFLKALDKDYAISNPYIFPYSGDFLLDIAVPVIQNDEVVGVIFTENSMNEIYSIMLEMSKETGWAFLLDRSLNIVFSTNKKYSKISKPSDDDIAKLGRKNVQKATSDILNRQNGSFVYKSDNVKKILVYQTISQTDWVLIVSVPQYSVVKELNSAAANIHSISLIILCIFLGLAFYVWFTKTSLLTSLEETAYYDSLTGLYNVVKFKIEMEKTLLENPDAQFDIIKFDITNFKVINEIYGYKTGNTVLKSIKLIFDKINDPSLIVCRIAADEFMAFAGNNLLRDIHRKTSIYEAYFRKVTPEIKGHKTSFRYGKYHIDLGNTDVDDIVNKVSLAHKIGKNAKEGIIHYYDELARVQLMIEAELTDKMEHALQNREFEVYLQPKFDLMEESLNGAEALIRWIGPSGKKVYPETFIPLFEKNGFIVQLDRYVLESVCIAMRRWIDQGKAILPISINCSRLNLSNANYVKDVETIVDSYKIPHEYIEIELTESSTIGNEEAIKKLFSEMHSCGFKISIDDFGSGYSSLAMLKNLHVDTLKMDKSFFSNSEIIRRDDMLIDGIVKLSHNLGMYVVAEGIETLDQVERLKAMNCDAVQGYYYSRPIPIPEFEEKYSEVMYQNALKAKDNIPLVNNINDARFANSFVPCGILIVDLDDSFTIIEANEGFFDLINYTREELRENFKNTIVDSIHPDDKELIMPYVHEKIILLPNNGIEFVCSLVNKNLGFKTVQFSGKIFINEHGQKRLYYTVVDIDRYSNNLRHLKEEREFNALIGSLTDLVFFDYDPENKSMRFSKNFANRFNIPDVINNFLETSVGKKMFPQGFHCNRDNSNNNNTPYTEGEFYLSLPSGENIWYLYSCKSIFDEETNKFRTVGKMTEIIGRKIDMDILKVKSESDLLTSAYSNIATNRYIHNYLRIATPNNDTSAFLVIDLDNFKQINETFGNSFADEALKETGKILRNSFRSIDIIGRLGGDEFFVFINGYKSIEFIEKKSAELLELLKTTYTKDGISLEISASIGISLYPEHGSNFETLFESAHKALIQVKNNGKNDFLIFDNTVI